ncbi:single-stranded-DNA-specific exonuclease RecJ [Paenibacillus hamazuiensis]|uniref:single-stranded-DNA-specific exonuclease RecJ n=1 Tax=Paenibacillus hamazuiensis TaxID=2936508 RepID=UPI00200D1C6F|nr:single-stranded-DNA-specific exonuclease RecJ [Paenibacillus hamazuiensis]
MLHPKARWNLNEASPGTAERLASELGIHPLVARLLVVRGFTDIEETKAFLYAGAEQIHDPYLLGGMKEAVERIRLALDRREKIRIYGDYDADGVSSTSLMIHLLRQFDCEFDYYIPHRVHEGYGLNNSALDHAKRGGVSLIVTVDTGISAYEEIAYARDIGIDVVVTDHHEPPEVLPEATAIVNPKKPGCPYPFKQLAGVGVALKLAQALLGRWPEELLEIATIGTIADLMPLVGENRLIVKGGLKRMQSTSYVGIRALLGIAGVECKDVNASHIGFSLGPRINASGRLGSADDAVKLLTSASEQEAEHLAFGLDQLNKERQRIVDEMTKMAFAMIEQNLESGGLPNVFVLAHEDWNVGVIGIVASKVLDKYYRPTIILGIDRETGMAKGSARSIIGFDIHKALTHCADLMDHFGGHQAAAGMTIHKDHLQELSDRLNRLAEEWLTPEDFIPILQADIECSLDEVTVDSIRQLELLAPFGQGNPSPRFVFSGLAPRELRTIGKDQQHLKLSLSKAEAAAGAALDAVGFGKGAMADWIAPSSRLDVLGELSINEWNGTRKPQVMIQDLRVPHVQVFDWRGAQAATGKLQELCRKLPDGPAVVFFDPPQAETVARMADACALWQCSLSGSWEPLNDKAKRSSLQGATDVVIGSLPPLLSDAETLIRLTDGAERYYAAFSEARSADSAVLPSRDMFKVVYTSLLHEGNAPDRFPALLRALSKRTGLSEKLIRFMIEVFDELGFVERRGEAYVPVPSPQKKDLSLSRKYLARMSRAEVEQVFVYSSGKELAEWICTRKTDRSSFKQINPLEEII